MGKCKPNSGAGFLVYENREESNGEKRKVGRENERTKQGGIFPLFQPVVESTSAEARELTTILLVTRASCILLLAVRGLTDYFTYRANPER